MEVPSDEWLNCKNRLYRHLLLNSKDILDIDEELYKVLEI